jgi:hypothetical protein
MDELVIESLEIIPDTHCDEIDLQPSATVRTLPAFDRPLQASVREIALVKAMPWVRTLGKLTMDVSTQGWRFPSPDDPVDVSPRPKDWTSE